MATHLDPLDVVPRLRRDLNVMSTPAGAGAEVIHVGPITSKDRVALRGFELSIALMLDGKRTARDVILGCERLGIPIDLESLDGFVDHLKRFGLLAGKNAPPVNAPRGRARWTSPERALYRSALHDVRSGAPELARDELNELLAASPDAVEAQELLQWIDKKDQGLKPKGSFEELVRDTEQSWSVDERLHPLADAAESLRRSPTPIVVLFAGAAVFVASVFVPLPRTIAASAELTPATEAPVLAPHPGVVGEVLVHEGDAVEAGAPLFSWNVDAAQIELAEARERLDLDREVTRSALAQTPSGSTLYERLLRAEAELTRARAVLMREQRDFAGAAPSEAAIRAEERFNKAHAEVEAAGEALDALNPLDSVSAMGLQGLVLQIRALEQEAKERAVLAPASGVVSHLFLKEGQQISGGQKLAQVDDLSRLKVRTVLTPRTAAHLQVGEPLTLRFGDTRVASKVEAVSDYEIAAEIPNPGGALKLGNTTVDLELSPRSIFDRIRE